MIEFPEAINLARQLSGAVAGKRVARVLPPTKKHAFTWFEGDPCDYDARLAGRIVSGAEGFGIYVSLVFDGGLRLSINDGVNPRFVKTSALPRDYQLAVCFDDGDAVVFTVAMYGGIVLHDESYGNDYYLKSKSAVSPFEPEFKVVFDAVLAAAKPTLSAKALIATEQRFPGVGNGVAQDILFNARLHPKRKLATLTDTDREALFASVVGTLKSMTDLGGRDTERDIFGSFGGYKTLMSKNTLASGCPRCGGAITKETYLGGSVYYCPACQPLVR